MTIGGTLLLRENVEILTGIENNTADMYMFGVEMDGTLKIILDMHGGVLGETGTGAKN